MVDNQALRPVGRHKFMYLPVALLALLCLLGSAGPLNAASARADDPLITIDAARGNYSLAGQWRFQPGDDPQWASADYDDARWSSRAVPRLWPRGGYPDTDHFAWYRLTIKFDLRSPGEREYLEGLAVRMGKVLSAYELYAGGQLLGGVGKLPPLSEIDYDRQKVFPLPLSAIAQDGSLVLALRVWGGEPAAVQHWNAGPFAGEFSVGNYRVLLLHGIVSELPTLLFCALIIGFGLYHLYLYRRNRQLHAYLWFGLVAINIGIYALMLSQWKYMLDWSFLALKKTEYGAIYLFPALAIQVVWTLLRQPIGRWLRVYQLSFVVCAILVVTIPGHAIHYQTLNHWQRWSIPLLGLAPWLVLREARAGNGEARTMMVGMLIFIATCVNDMLIDQAGLQTVRLIPWGLVAIILTMSVSLANRFTTMLNELEDAVTERTAELSAANAQLAVAARVDPLTGLLNRRGFAEEADAEIQRVFRTGRSFTLILADVDNFKRFNDSCGHACGDHVLMRLADIFSASMRDVDRVARWGGEEFILLLPETELDGASTLAEKLRQTIADNLFEFDGQRQGITMTFGIASHRKGETLDTCIARADTALYHGKDRGRNKVMIGSYKGLTLVS